MTTEIEYNTMTLEESGNWAHEYVKTDVTADSTDEQIEALFDRYDAEAKSIVNHNEDGEEFYAELDYGLVGAMKEYRNELRAELADA